VHCTSDGGFRIPLALVSVRVSFAVKIALIAAPFIAVPPADYGGTELFVAQLAEGLKRAGVEPIVYANGESRVNTERRWKYERSQWPIKDAQEAWTKELHHTAWAIRDAMEYSDLVHVQSAQALAFSKFTQTPFVLTLHGPHEATLSEFYRDYPDVQFVAISDAQARQESLTKLCTIHHGIDISSYRFIENKQPYLSFIGRIAPIKGTHIAIDVAQRSGIPLKIAGEVQPAFREYFEKKVRPHIDGKQVEYVGPADLNMKNELLGNSMAMLFPIQWSEPFGLVMVEAMACGTPVLAMPGGSVKEVVKEGVSGYVCRSVREMTKRLQNLNVKPETVHHYVKENFSIEKMVRKYIRVYEQILQQKKKTEEAA
jgi:glycosyltransferase involved in cell wall biosynthesis